MKKEEVPAAVEVKKEEIPAEEELPTPVPVAEKASILEDQKDDEQPAAEWNW